MKYASLVVIIALVSMPAHAGVIRSRSGATATVANDATTNFQCLIDRLDGAGYPIKFMGGLSSGHMRHSLHHTGHALDINQTARNVVTARFPGGVNEMASSCGLFHGALWRDADTGHFQKGGYQNARSTIARSTGRMIIADMPANGWIGVVSPPTSPLLSSPISWRPFSPSSSVRPFSRRVHARRP